VKIRNEKEKFLKIEERLLGLRRWLGNWRKDRRGWM
jgi:hypothetical protein